MNNEASGPGMGGDSSGRVKRVSPSSVRARGPRSATVIHHGSTKPIQSTDATGQSKIYFWCVVRERIARCGVGGVLGQWQGTERERIASITEFRHVQHGFLLRFSQRIWNIWGRSQQGSHLQRRGCFQLLIQGSVPTDNVTSNKTDSATWRVILASVADQLLAVICVLFFLLEDPDTVVTLLFPAHLSQSQSSLILRPSIKQASGHIYDIYPPTQVHFNCRRSSAGVSRLSVVVSTGNYSNTETQFGYRGGLFFVSGWGHSWAQQDSTVHLLDCKCSTIAVRVSPRLYHTEWRSTQQTCSTLLGCYT